jgi:hypothetical protein
MTEQNYCREMKNVVSYCGLLCDGCPIFWATKEKDVILKENMRIEIAKLSNKLYKTNFCSKDITDCDGCLTENARLFPGCIDCKIRNCAREKNLLNCANCSDYVCESLDTFFKDNAEAKSRLDFIRSILHTTPQKHHCT